LFGGGGHLGFLNKKNLEGHLNIITYNSMIHVVSEMLWDFKLLETINGLASLTKWWICLEEPTNIIPANIHSNRTNSFNCLFVCLMVLNATFNNISVVSWWSVLLVEETVGTGENHRPVASHWQTLSHNVAHLALIETRIHNISGDRHWLHW
jgi:hypothetical protein